MRACRGFDRFGRWENSAVIARKIALLAGAILICAALLEVGSYLIYYVSRGEGFSARDERQRLASPLQDAGAAGRVDGQTGLPPSVRNKALHPFLGYVYNHTRDPFDTNRFGFEGASPLVKRSPETVNLVILGGSVAVQLYRHGSERLVEQLRKDPRYRDKKFRILSLALGGYKQPQQLMALTYMLSLGAEYDLAINLDGFNEIALPYTENVPAGVYPAFPRVWNLYARLGLDLPQSLHLARVEQLTRRRDRWRARVIGTPLDRSAFFLTALGSVDRYFENQIAREDALLRARLDAAENDFQISGPFDPYETDAQLFDDLVALWKRSSLQMAHLSQGNGIRYLHFLQPNQYVPGSKELSSEEHRTAFHKGPGKPKQAVRAAYGLLSREGADLGQRGVEFYDLTGLFRGERRTIYQDPCCHVNQLGNELMAEAMASAILAGGLR